MKKREQIKALSLLLSLALVLSLLPGTAWAAGEEDAVEIASASELETFRDRVNSGETGLCAILTADIPLSGQWTPFNPPSGYVTEAYAGTFDGGGHTISGLDIQDSGSGGVGLFGTVNGAVIQNLKVEGSVFASNSAFVGGIVGKTAGAVTIENCSFSGSVRSEKTGTAGAGGIAGRVNGGAVSIRSCVNSADVTGSCAGGILGYCTSRGNLIESCYNTGAVSGASKAGGIAGQVHSTTGITNCYTTQAGVCGFNGSLTNCYDEANPPAAPSDLGDAFTLDAQGNIILTWQAGSAPAPRDPRVEISGPSTLYMTNSGQQPGATLTARCIDMDGAPDVTWSLVSGDSAVTLIQSDSNTCIVQAAAPGRAVVRAEAGGYADELALTVCPFVTTVELSGTAAVGGTVQAKLNVLGGGAFDHDYADPNTTPTLRFGSFRVVFTLSRGGETLDRELPVILCWDADRVREVMTREILDRLDLPSGTVTGRLSLPKAVDGKRWALIEWTSSNEDVISISTEDQTTADTLFAPYVAVVRQGTGPQEVTLTARVTFRLTSSVAGGEKPIVLYRTFRLTVPPMGGEQLEAVRLQLEKKLDQGFAARGLTDAATGARLTAGEDGTYSAANDIQLPTTRDFGVDGKYYPVTITTGSSEVLKAPDVNNAARVEVYRPGVGQPDAEGAVTVTLHDRDTSVTASRTFRISVPALTREEIDAELALMERVKASYFDGIRGGNSARDNVRTDLTPFQEVYEGGDGELVWVRTRGAQTGRGIVPVPMEGWEELEAWRLFRSSNPNVISHENLLVSRQSEAKAVTVTSRLSSETLGRYGALYAADPVRYAQYAALAPLYYQEVTTDALAQPAVRRTRAAVHADRTGSDAGTMVVRGTRDPDSAIPVAETVDVTFSLTGLDGEVWISPTALTGLDETLTVYDVFTRMLTENGCTATRQKGTYIVSVSGPRGTLAEKDHGEHSGWMYRVNGAIPDVYMGACPLHSGDTVQVFYTKNAGQDDPNWSWPSDGSSGSGGSSSGGGDSSGGSPSGGGSSGTGSSNTPAGAPDTAQSPRVQVEQRGDGSYAVTLPKGVSGPQLVTIPAGEQGGVLVILHPDGEREIIKKSILEDGRGKFLLEQDAVVQVERYTNPFQDVAGPAWYASAVDFVAGRALFSGVGQDTFAPDLPLSRGMLSTVLYRLEAPGPQSPDALFTDVPEGSWYAEGALWAAGAGIVSGYGDGRFGPSDSITREQLALMLFRYAQHLDLNTGGRDSLTGFSDGGSISPWAREAVAWAVDSGILSGLPDGTLAPGGTASRAQAAAMLQQLVRILLK